MPDKTGGQADGRTGLASLHNLIGALRRIAGMPDYLAYTEHLRRCHPQLPIPSERQFFDDFVRTRYGDGPTRCC